jgi:hypothetical protein
MKKLIPLILAFLVVAHHYYIHGVWFEWTDLNSHEMLAVLLLGVWIGLMINTRAHS